MHHAAHRPSEIFEDRVGVFVGVAAVDDDREVEAVRPIELAAERGLLDIAGVAAAEPIETRFPDPDASGVSGEGFDGGPILFARGGGVVRVDTRRREDVGFGIREFEAERGRHGVRPDVDETDHPGIPRPLQGFLEVRGEVLEIEMGMGVDDGHAVGSLTRRSE